MSDATAPLGFLPMGQPNRFDVYLHIDITQTAPASDPRIAEIIGALSRIEGKVDKMANLDEVIAASTNAAKIADALDENVPPPAAAKKK